MFRQTKNYLLASAFGLIVLCITVFSGVGIYMSNRSEDAISEIGRIYMSEMSRQIQQKFDAVIDLRLSQAEGIVRIVSSRGLSTEELREELAENAKVRGFTYLGLYTEDGEEESVYGGTVEPVDENEFLEVLREDEKRAYSGYDESGNKVLLLSANAYYPMQDGRASSFMVVGLPIEYLNTALVLEEENSMVYYHIIHRDGTFVIRSGGAYRGNYFNRMRELISEFGDMMPEQYVQEFQDAISANEDYSALVLLEGGRRHLYCSPLPDSDWYLVAVMPYGVLDDAIEHLGSQRQNIMLGACSIILAAVILSFIHYYRMSQQQLRELNRAEQAAVQANRAKSEFLSNMSHDIRTPMNGIVGMTAIAMSDINNTARVQDCLGKITMSSRHLLGLINDVLDMSRIESGKLSLNLDQMSLHEAMDNIVNIVKPQIGAKKQHFDIFIQDIQTEEVCCDSVRLNQVLINLLSNAMKFTPEEGRINVYLRQEDSPKGSNYVRCHFRVKDNGIGMSPEFRKTIFDTFTREKTDQVNRTEGTGLGMAITKCIVDMMGGAIELLSEPGKGTEFHIVLDLEKATTKIEDMCLPPWRMLVIDNNKDLCLSAVSSLKEMGVEAEWATDGYSAVDLVRKRHQERNDYEIVLLDWKMPGMSGLQTAKEIRKIVGEEAILLIISAYDWSDIEEEAAGAGVRGFISKPLFKSSLYVGLTRYMLDEEEAREQEKKEEAGSFEGRRILLAEDNDLNWEIAEALLSEEGFELERAENGRICVEKFTGSAENYYDAILMDIRMPVMTGYDAAAEIRKLARSDAGLPIIAMTADAFSEDIERCRQCGMDEHVSKPVDVDKLIQILGRYLK